MSSTIQIEGIAFPKRRSNHGGTWRPIYLEPVVGSGERLCIGIAASDGQSFVVTPVPALDRLACVYGPSAKAFAWAADLALSEARHLLTSRPLSDLATLCPSINGLVIGEPRQGAGTGLADLARVAMNQCSSLAEGLSWPDRFDEQPQTALAAVGKSSRLEAQIRRAVVILRPEFKERFGRTFRASQATRPLRFGYVGRHIAANFTALAGIATKSLAPQVDRSKARLWDLQQLKDGVLADGFKFGNEALSYELLVHRPNADYAANDARARVHVKEAEEELEAEADKFNIRFRPFTSPQQIAEFVMGREAVELESIRHR